jgi:hypothetical protein
VQLLRSLLYVANVALSVGLTRSRTQANTPTDSLDNQFTLMLLVMTYNAYVIGAVLLHVSKLFRSWEARRLMV